MLRVITFALLAMFVLLARSPALAQDTAPGISCRAYLVYDLSGERTLAVHNPYHKQPIASLTKMMTALLAAENLRFDGRYVLTAEEQKTFKVETMRADKMLEMMMIPSNNAVCKVVARIISGSETEFAKLMNSRAAELSMNDTRFVNASGLPGEGQQSTLFDLLTLSRVAMSSPHVCSAMCKPAVELEGTWYKGTLRDLYDRHPQLVGGKTGYTKAAGRCLVLHYRSGGRDYIVITLGSKNVAHSFRDAELILSHHGLYSGPVGNWGIEGLDAR